MCSPGDYLMVSERAFWRYASCLNRRVIVNWNFVSFCLRLLVLSGDISLNPGPEPIFCPCSVCGESVLDSHEAVCCDYLLLL